MSRTDARSRLIPHRALDPTADSVTAMIDQLRHREVLRVGGAVIFVVVMALAVYGVFAKAKNINSRGWILGGGLAFPSSR